MKSDCHALHHGCRAECCLDGGKSEKRRKEQETDVLLIGGGIMSATLGTYLQGAGAAMVNDHGCERLDGVAQESSNGWNNAGTGPPALMELNYTPKRPTVKHQH